MISILERNLEDLIVQRLEKIEPGLRLEQRQLGTPAGRLDLLCRDAYGNYVVIELKKTRGTDQVVGQILRYIGWLKETYPEKDARGIIIVAQKDETLLYAVRAAPNIAVREFDVSIK